MKTAASKMTYAQYCVLPDDGKQYEVIDGELFVTPAPTPRHQEILGELLFRLHTHVEANSLGKVYPGRVDIVFDQHTVVQPDVLFISNARLGIVKEEAIEGAPDLVVEVLLPSTFYKDLRPKMTAYSQFGVQEYWIVDPEKQTIELHTRAGEGLQLARSFSSDDTFESPLLPGFRLAVRSIF